ncbi:MAG: autotransporter domain-containing protein [Ignavibacteriales bacterium]
MAQVYPMGDGDATVTVGDGSTIIATLGAEALANSSGDATVQLGSNVTLDQTLLGAYASSRGRSLVSAGDNLTVTMQWSPFNPQRVGLYAHTTALADDGSPSAEVNVGNNATIINTDTSTFDGAGIYAESYFGSASSRVTVGDGLDVQMAGEYVVGVAGYAYLGDVDVTVGSGSITLTGGDPVSFVTVAPATGGIIADARGGDVSVTSAVDMNVASHGAPVFGIDAFTTGSGNVSVSSSGAITSSGLGVGATAVDGQLAIDNSGSVTGSTTGILARTTGAGRISVTSSGSAHGADAAIDASTLSGRVQVTSTGSLKGDVGVRAASQDGEVAVTATGSVIAWTTGVDATAHGAGALSVQAGGVQAGDVGVRATTDSSNAMVTASGDIFAGSGSAIDIDSGGAARVDVVMGATVKSTAPAVNIVAAGPVTINNHGTIRSTAGGAGDLVLKVDPPAATLNNSGTLLGAVDFTGSGSLAFTNSGVWRTAMMSVFTAGGDTLTNSGVIATSGATTIDFGAGSDTLTNSGRLVAGQGGASTLTLANLETFANSGLVLFGSNDWMTTDGEANDRLVAAGTTFTGSGASTLAMDVDLGAAAQANCSAATVADCFDLTGGSTAGSTLIRVSDTGDSAGALNTAGIVLVDVHGGTSHAADFTLDPTSAGYTVDPTLGAGLEKGLFLYQLDYDAANQRHRLVSLPNSRAFEFAPLAASAQSVWYTSVGSWFDRQADLRDTLAAGDTGPGVWIKLAGANDNRDATSAYGPYAFNISNKQTTFAALAGIDLLHGASGGQGYVVGLTAGELNSDVQFKASHRSAKLEGQSYGAYATWLSNSFFLDAIVQQNDLDLRDNAAFGAKGKVKSTGGQVEGGWRMPFASLSVEPLASLAYVRTKFDDLALPGATLHTEEAKSLRGSLGVRVSGDTDLHSATLKWQATGRVWDEFEGKNRAVLISNGQSVGMPDDVSGAFGDVGVGVSLYAPSGHVSTFLNTGLKFKDDYRSTNTAIGFRVQW